MDKEMNKTYDPKAVEDRIYSEWMQDGCFHAEIDENKKPFTIV
ncbi:MAG TPA: valyl-tRNA synthetase, partial [Clostridia bacterium]|nr:valyl-tRNA synthetase [Clostridia bacterium]